MKKFLGLLAILSILTLFVVACGGASSTTNTTSSSSSSGTAQTVHMNATNFTQNSITIHKGDSLKLVNDASVTHIISNGEWQNGTPKPMKESGAPTVNNQTVAANQSITVGPFTSSGTFHLYCTVHQNMNLTVTVQ